jgi:hypothetical protein
LGKTQFHYGNPWRPESWPVFWEAFALFGWEGGWVMAGWKKFTGSILRPKG